MSNSVNEGHPSARFTLLDKVSGQCVGILSLKHGQILPDLSRVELYKINDSLEPVNQDKTAAYTEDLNTNNVCLSLERMVDTFVGQLERNSHFGSEFPQRKLKGG